MSEANVLTSIIDGVLEDVKSRIVPISQLQEQLQGAPKLRGAHDSLSKSGMRLIAEVKRSSPSKGDLAQISDPVALASKYQEGGADVISVLTEGRRFKGSIADLVAVRSAIDLPVLRKDFIVTEFQVYESRILGADLLLLIVAGLSKSQLVDFYQLAQGLGMDVLVEVHDRQELDLALTMDLALVGINNRNLHSFEVSLDNTYQLLEKIPDNRIVITESGIHSREDVAAMRQQKVNAFLVGEAFMRSEEPGDRLSEMFS